MNGTPEQFCDLVNKYFLGMATKGDIDTFLGNGFSLSELLDVYYHFSNIPLEIHYTFLISKLVKNQPLKQWWILSPNLVSSFVQYFSKTEALVKLEELLQ